MAEVRIRLGGDASGLTDGLPAVGLLLRRLNAEYHLPRFQHEQTFSQDAHGVSFSVRDRLLGRRLAFKFVPADQCQAAASLRREQYALSRLNHPNILPLIDAGRAEGELHWLCMPLVPGHSLLRQPKPPSWRHGLQALVPIVDALQHAHAQGLVHGDVHPGNILLTEDGQAVLVDWGSSRLRDEDSDDQAVPQAPDYAAPECFLGASRDPRSDVFSIGASLRYWLGDTIQPRGLQAVLATCLQAEPQQRYADMAALRADLQALLTGEAPSVCPDPLPLRCWRWSRRHPAFAAVLILLVLSLSGWINMLLREATLRQRSWQVVHVEDFEAPPDPELWECRIYPRWRQDQQIRVAIDDSKAPWLLRDGALESRWTKRWQGAVTWQWRHRIGSDLRLSWTVTPLHSGENCNAFLGPDRFSGWTVHIGGFERENLLLLSDGRLDGQPRVVSGIAMQQALQVGRTYRLCFQLVDGVVSLDIDGETVLRYHDPLQFRRSGLAGCGLETSRNRLRIDDILIERLSRSAVVPVHAIADRLLLAGQIPEALSEYRLAADRSQTPAERAWVRLRQSRCLELLGHHDQASANRVMVASDASVPRYWRGTAMLQLGLEAIQQQDWAAVAHIGGQLRAMDVDTALRAQLFLSLSSELWQHRKAPVGDRVDADQMRGYGSQLLQWQRKFQLQPKHYRGLAFGHGLGAWARVLLDHLLLPRFADMLTALDPWLLQQLRLEPDLPDLNFTAAVGALPATEGIIASGSVRILVNAADEQDWWQQLRNALRQADEKAMQRALAAGAAAPMTRKKPPQRLALVRAVIQFGYQRPDQARAVLQDCLADPRAQALSTVQPLLHGLLHGQVPGRVSEAVSMRLAPKALFEALAAEFAGDSAAAARAYTDLSERSDWRDLAQWRMRRL